MKNFLNKLTHKHEWNEYFEEMEHEGIEVKVKHRYCSGCGRKEVCRFLPCLVSTVNSERYWCSV